jgi:hypothetical protein
MSSPDEKLQLLTILLDRRLEHLCLEAPDLLEAGADLLEEGLVRCGGGVAIRNENGKVLDLRNIEITAAGRKFLQETEAKGPFRAWVRLHRERIRFSLLLGALLFLLVMALLKRGQ